MWFVTWGFGRAIRKLDIFDMRPFGFSSIAMAEPRYPSPKIS